MGACSRCLVHDALIKHGRENVVEVVVDDEYGLRYEIYLKGYKTQKTITVEGETYGWIMGVYSMQHSLDEDCAIGINPRVDPQRGYPRVVVPDLPASEPRLYTSKAVYGFYHFMCPNCGAKLLVDWFEDPYKGIPKAGRYDTICIVCLAPFNLDVQTTSAIYKANLP